MTNLVAAFNRWDAGCWNYPNQHLTGAEFLYGGIADYGQPYPCPNGLPLDTRSPGEHPGMRRHIEKARRDIEEHKQHIEWIDTVEAAHVEWPSESVSELRAFISEVMG